MQRHRIYYYCPDVSAPSGGVRSIYTHVETLCQAGFQAYVLHGDRDFRVTWFDSDAPIRYLTPGIPIRPTDVLVIPEGWPGMMRDTAGTTFARVVFAQGWPNIFSILKPGTDWRTFGIKHVISVGCYTSAFIKETMGLDSVIIEPYIDPEIFHETPLVTRRLQVAYMPRKNQNDSRQIEGIFKAKFPCYAGVPFVPIDNMSPPEVANVLRQSAIFLATGYPEGLGLPGLEAMACGAVVVGFSGRGGLDYMQPGVNSFIADDTDVMSAAELLREAIERSVAGSLDNVRQCAHQALAPYHPEAFRAKLLSFWSQFLECLDPPETPQHTVEWIGASQFSHASEHP